MGAFGRTCAGLRIADCGGAGGKLLGQSLPPPARRSRPRRSHWKETVVDHRAGIMVRISRRPERSPAATRRPRSGGAARQHRPAFSAAVGSLQVATAASFWGRREAATNLRVDPGRDPSSRSRVRGADSGPRGKSGLPGRRYPKPQLGISARICPARPGWEPLLGGKSDGAGDLLRGQHPRAFGQIGYRSAAGAIGTTPQLGSFLSLWTAPRTVRRLPIRHRGFELATSSFDCRRRSARIHSTKLA